MVFLYFESSEEESIHLVDVSCYTPSFLSKIVEVVIVKYECEV